MSCIVTYTACRTKHIYYIGEAFVDDSGLTVNSTSTMVVME